jgi:hypothetical protein
VGELLDPKLPGPTSFVALAGKKIVRLYSENKVLNLHVLEQSTLFGTNLEYESGEKFF